VWGVVVGVGEVWLWVLGWWGCGGCVGGVVWGFGGVLLGCFVRGGVGEWWEFLLVCCVGFLWGFFLGCWSGTKGWWFEFGVVGDVGVFVGGKGGPPLPPTPTPPPSKNTPKMPLAVRKDYVGRFKNAHAPTVKKGDFKSRAWMGRHRRFNRPSTLGNLERRGSTRSRGTRVADQDHVAVARGGTDDCVKVGEKHTSSVRRNAGTGVRTGRERRHMRPSPNAWISPPVPLKTAA